MIAAPRLFAAVGLVAMLAWSGYEAVRYGVVGAATGNAGRELERASRAGATAAPWWRDDLRRATAEANDPTAHELLALSIMYASNDAEDLAEAQRQLNAAIGARPGSGYTWANLMGVKYRLGDTGASFERAIVNAAALGPYEPEVQRTVVDLGLAVIDQTAPATKAAIERTLASGMKRNAPEILQIAVRRGRLDAACRHLVAVPRPAESKWTQLCQSMEATS